MLKVLAARDPDCYVFACAGLIGATPELLIQREGRQARSRVIAGTAAHGVPAEDHEISEALLASAKDSEEHGKRQARRDDRAASQPPRPTNHGPEAGQLSLSAT